MDSEELIGLMSSSVYKNIEYVDSTGKKQKGYVWGFSSRYDTDGEASIDFEGDNGEMLIVDESDISDMWIILQN